MTASRSPQADDVVVIGAGLVGLSCAAALATTGHRVILLAVVRRGEASAAAAGILAPSVNPWPGAAGDFAVRARDRFPSLLETLKTSTGIDVPLNRDGILELAHHETAGERMAAASPQNSTWLEAGELARLEPALGQHPGALLHPDDGAVNNLVLMRAFKAFLTAHSRVTVRVETATQLAARGDGLVITTLSEQTLSVPNVVLATGCWTPYVGGLPRMLPIAPQRGQMISLAGPPIGHVVIGRGGYVVPRGDGRVLAGTTADDAGFDASTTEEGLATVRHIATGLCPPLATARMLNAWAGLRPMTPDGLPIIGAEPGLPGLFYACGHSRSGVLTAPLTGDCIAALVAREAPGIDLAPFSPARFQIA